MAGVCWSVCAARITRPDILRPSFHTDMLRTFRYFFFFQYVFDYEGIYAFYHQDSATAHGIFKCIRYLPCGKF